MENFKHVVQYFNQYTFKLTINGERVIPQAWWVTRGQTSFYAELSKFYYRTVYGLDHHTVQISPHVTPEEFSAHAVSLGIDLTKPAEVFTYLPKGIQAHILRNKTGLENQAVLNLNTDFKRAVSSALASLRSVVSSLRPAVEKTSGPQKEFLEIAVRVFTEYATDFEASAIKASTPADIKPV